ncbi:MAG TPA: flagellar export chaperone FliS [Pirellulales bacterium]|jgi:flagellar protein FliS|nr:flagellar export chaperone FliS [Pirellulales bacterium]
MSSTSREKYLEQEVLSAPPQKLQLLLIEAAIRQITKARLLWSQPQTAAAGQAIVRAQGMLTQMLAGLHPDRSQPLVRRVAAVYSFVIKSLAKAYLQQNEEALADALRVLEIERETWRQVCQELGNQKPTSIAAPHFGHVPQGVMQTPTERLSLEA